MKLLTIDGFGYNLSVDNGRLEATNGHYHERQKQTKKYRRKELDFDKVIITGNHGTISVSAIRWLMKQKRDIAILDWNGRLITAFSPSGNQGVSRLAQFKACEDPAKKTGIARWLIQHKIEGTIRVLDWIKTRKYKFSYDKIIDECLERIKGASSIQEVIGIEATASRNYWDAVESTIDSKWEFLPRHGKNVSTRDADDPVNALFNYGYAILESECWKVINIMGLEPYIGFIHMTHTNKAPFVYDLQEPFRWLVDKAILKIIYEKKLSKNDFTISDEGNTMLRQGAVNLVLEEIAWQFRSRTVYHGMRREWQTMIMLKCREMIKMFDV